MGKTVEDYVELRLQEYDFSKPGCPDEGHATGIRGTRLKYNPDFPTSDLSFNIRAGVTRVLQ